MNTHTHITSLKLLSGFQITSHLWANTFLFSSESMHADRDLDDPSPLFTSHVQLLPVRLLGLILISNLS